MKTLREATGLILVGSIRLEVKTPEPAGGRAFVADAEGLIRSMSERRNVTPNAWRRPRPSGGVVSRSPVCQYPVISPELHQNCLGSSTLSKRRPPASMYCSAFALISPLEAREQMASTASA